MNKVALFEKVSYEQFEKDWEKTFSHIMYTKDEIRNIYDNITLPKRATTGSAGYDFFAPDNFVISSGSSAKIPTGIRCKISDGWVLMCYPRSSMGFKYRLQLDNTTAVIDSDYYNADNEGHIFLKVSCDSFDHEDIVDILSGEAFVQGVFVPFGITEDDEVNEVRHGGIGSTSK